MSENAKIEYDQRQYERMSLALRQYEDGVINLPSLVAGLEALLASLEGADREWVERFQGEWWTLEQIHAVGADRGRGRVEFSGEEEAEIQAAIANLRRLLADRLTWLTA